MVSFNPLALVLSFTAGIFFMLMYTPRPRLVVRFPMPGGTSDVYHSEGSCYRVRSDAVKCPSDRSLVLPQPVTEDDVPESDAPYVRFFQNN